MINSIIEGIKAQIGISLPDYKEIPFVLDPSKNQRGALNKGYVVRPLAGNENEGALKHLTITREFTVLLTREYIGHPTNDSGIVDLMIETLQDAENLYKDIVQTNLGGNGVLVVHSLRSEDPQPDIINKNIQVPILFSVQYIQRI